MNGKRRAGNEFRELLAIYQRPSQENGTAGKRRDLRRNATGAERKERKIVRGQTDKQGATGISGATNVAPEWNQARELSRGAYPTILLQFKTTGEIIFGFLEFNRLTEKWMPLALVRLKPR